MVGTPELENFSRGRWNAEDAVVFQLINGEISQQAVRYSNYAQTACYTIVEITQANSPHDTGIDEGWRPMAAPIESCWGWLVGRPHAPEFQL